jgi:hypothetical protein
VRHELPADTSRVRDHHNLSHVLLFRVTAC